MTPMFNRRAWLIYWLLFTSALVGSDSLVWIATGHMPTALEVTTLTFRHLTDAAIFAWVVGNPWRMWALFIGTALALHVVTSLIVIGLSQVVPVPLSALSWIQLARWLLADGAALAVVVRAVHRSSSTAV